MTIEDMKPPTAIPEAKFVACFQRGIFANVFSTFCGWCSGSGWFADDDAVLETLRYEDVRFACLTFEAGLNACAVPGS